MRPGYFCEDSIGSYVKMTCNKPVINLRQSHKFYLKGERTILDFDSLIKWGWNTIDKDTFEYYIILKGIKTIDNKDTIARELI